MDETDAVFASLRHGFLTGRLAHAYLVVGPPRGAAGRLADRLLALLFCGAADAARPCGACAGCRHAAAHSHTDLLWVEPRKKSRAILVDQVQAVRRHVSQTSMLGGWKAVVLVHAERLNEPAANTLLKTLEEPPPRTAFLLLTDAPEALLPTVVSRCQRLALAETDAAGDADVRAAVAALVDATPGAGPLAGIGRARRLQDWLKQTRKRIESEEKEDAPEAADTNAALREELEDQRKARVEARYREARARLLRALLYWHRDLLVCVAGGEDAALTFREEAARVRRAARGLTLRDALANIRRIETMHSRLERHLAEALVFEYGCAGLTAADGTER